MIAPSKIRATLADARSRRRTRQMADVMLHHVQGPEGACTVTDLHAAGFTDVEIAALADGARRLNCETPPVVLAPSFAQLEGQRLVRKAQRLRARNAARAAS